MILTRALLILGAAAPAAELDNNVEWSGITHLEFSDRQPLCPLNGETFAVQVRTWSNDVSSVRIWVEDDQELPASYEAASVGTRGPYEIWEGQVPSTTSDDLLYYFELTDGSDSDYLGAAGMTNIAPVGDEYVMNFATLSHAPLGATPHPDGGTVFRVWAPNPTTAHVRGQFNGWGLANPMMPDGDFFSVVVPQADPGDMFKFYFSPGEVWKPDARALSLNPGDNYNTHVYDTSNYVWNDAGFAVPAFEDMVIYELHVGTFSGRNDGGTNYPPTYREVVDLHVDHLVDLGINVVELMPVTEFPWDYSGGYNPVTAWAPESVWGSPDDLKYLIDRLHQNGIAVIHDIVWNHFSGSDNYLWNYDGTQAYFDTPAAETPWGAQADFDEPEVRDYFVHSMHVWLEEFHIDGFRMDATSFMDPLQSAGWGLMQRFNDEIDARWVDKIAIAEQLPDDPWVTRPTSLGGAGFDSQWHDRFTDDIREAIFDAAFGDPQMWKVRGAVLGSGTYLEGVQAVNYIETHDEAWPSSGGQRLVKSIDTTFPHDDAFAQGRTKLGHALTMFAPGIPMFLQGCEFLEDTGFGASAPGAPEARLDWSKVQTYSGYLQFFRDMIGVRRGNEALKANAPVDVSHLNESGNVIGFHRWNDAGNDLMVVVSFNNGDFTDYEIGFPQPGTWYEILNSQADIYGGSGLGNGGSVTTMPVARDGFPDSAAINVPRMGVLVFRYDDPPCSFTDLNGDGTSDLLDFAVFQDCFDGSDCGADADFNDDGVVDLEDFAFLEDNLAGDC